MSKRKKRRLSRTTTDVPPAKGAYRLVDGTWVLEQVTTRTITDRYNRQRKIILRSEQYVEPDIHQLAQIFLDLAVDQERRKQRDEPPTTDAESSDRAA